MLAFEALDVPDGNIGVFSKLFLGPAFLRSQPVKPSAKFPPYFLSHSLGF